MQSSVKDYKMSCLKGPDNVMPVNMSIVFKPNLIDFKLYVIYLTNGLTKVMNILKDHKTLHYSHICGACVILHNSYRNDDYNLWWHSA